MSARVPWARRLVDLNKSRLKDRLALCAALSIGQYEITSLCFSRPYVLRVVSSLLCH